MLNDLDDIGSIPRNERALVTFVTDRPSAADAIVEGFRMPSMNAKKLLEVAGTVATVSSLVLPVGWVVRAGVAAAATATHLVSSRQKKVPSRRSLLGGAPLRRLSIDVANQLVFPNGDPQVGTVYVIHPLQPLTYIPIESFHSFLPQQKFAEFLRLVSSLGATKIQGRLERNEGREGGGSTKVKIPGVSSRSVGGKGNAKADGNRTENTVYSAELNGAEIPTIPDDLVWYEQEHQWKEMAEQRLNHGLKRFTLSFDYRDDFGINANVAAKLAKVGFELSGEFKTFEATKWRFECEFR